MAMFNSENSEDQVIFKETSDLLWRNRKFIGITFGVFVLAAYLVILYPSSKYESYALVMVHLGRENAEVPLTVENGSMFTNGVQKEEINSYARVLSSRSLLEETVDAVGLDRYTTDPNKPETLLQYAKYYAKRVAKFGKRQVDEVLIQAGLRARLSDRDKVLKLLERSLTAERERDSNVIRVVLRLADPVLARDTIGQLLRVYQERHIEMRQNSDVQLVFADQAEKYIEQIAAKRREMDDIRGQWGISSVEEQQKQIARNALQAKYDRDSRYSTLEDLKQQEQALLAKLDELPAIRKQHEVFEPNPNVETLKSEIVRNKIEKAERQFDDNTLPARQLQARVDELEGLLKKEDELLSTNTTYEPNPLVDHLKSTLLTLKGQQAGIQAAIEQDTRNIAVLEQEIAKLNEGADALGIAMLEYDVLTKRYEASAARVEQAKAEHELDSKQIANVSIVGAPTLSFDPVAPRRLLLMGVALLAGLVISCGLALLKEWFNPRLHRERDLRAMENVVLLGEYHLSNGNAPSLQVSTMSNPVFKQPASE